jgi:hypothetical protein
MFVVEGVFRNSGVIHSFSIVDPVLFVWKSESVIQNRENLLELYVDVASRTFNTLFSILNYAVEKVPEINHDREIFFLVINGVSMVPN